MLDYLNPIQLGLGLGVSKGCEAAVYACRRYITFMQNNNVIAKLEFITLLTVYIEMVF